MVEWHCQWQLFPAWGETEKTTFKRNKVRQWINFCSWQMFTIRHKGSIRKVDTFVDQCTVVKTEEDRFRTIEKENIKYNHLQWQLVCLLSPQRFRGVADTGMEVCTISSRHTQISAFLASLPICKERRI